MEMHSDKLLLYFRDKNPRERILGRSALCQIPFNYSIYA